MELLADMFRRGHVADIAWFLGGAWLLFLFFGLVVVKLWKKVRRRKEPYAKS